MKNFESKIKAIGLVCAVMVLVFLVGCAGRYTGGGWIPSAVGPEAKATFGFNAEAFDTGDGLAVRGHISYNDHGVGVRCQCRIDDGFIGPITGSGYFSGEVVNGDGTDCLIWVIDEGEPGWGNDMMGIQLFDNGSSIYGNIGTIEGGNIQYHPSQGNKGNSFD